MADPVLEIRDFFLVLLQPVPEVIRHEFWQHLADEAGLAGAGDAGDGREGGEGEIDVEAVEVVAGDAAEPEPDRFFSDAGEETALTDLRTPSANDWRIDPTARERGRR